MRNHGFIAAGRGRRFSNQLSRLSQGDKIFVYQAGAGYVGYGVVSSTEPVMAKDFIAEDGRSLDDLRLDRQLKEPGILEYRDDPELSDYLVSVKWKKTFPKSEPKRLEGGFANRAIVCNCETPERSTFLRRLLAWNPLRYPRCGLRSRK